ncbi:MAG: hypothetical protein WD356_10770 [Pseudomonadales bacterium]
MQFLLIFQYPLFAHTAVLMEEEQFKLLSLMLLVIGIHYRGLLAFRMSAMISTLALITGLAAVWFFGWISVLIYMLPTVIPLVLLIAFGTTLLPGRTPMVTAIALGAEGSLNAEMRHYTRSLTWLWVIVFVVLTLESVLMFLFANSVLWSWVINITNPILIGGIFVGEFVFRKIRFPDHPHPSFKDYIQIVRTARKS